MPRNKQIIKYFVILIFGGLIISSCSVQSRTYGPIKEMKNPPNKYGFTEVSSPQISNRFWKLYLNGFNASGEKLKNKKLESFPNPNSVIDLNLKIISFMGQRQGLDYALGGGHLDNIIGVSTGTIKDHVDFGKKGMDCTGLIREAFFKTTGIDLHKVTGNEEDYFNRSDTIAIFDYFKTSGAIVGGEEMINTTDLENLLPQMKTGDIIIYEKNGVNGHATIYVGNGQLVETDVPGTKAHFSEISKKERVITVFRPNQFI